VLAVGEAPHLLAERRRHPVVDHQTRRGAERRSRGVRQMQGVHRERRLRQVLQTRYVWGAWDGDPRRGIVQERRRGLMCVVDSFQERQWVGDQRLVFRVGYRHLLQQAEEWVAQPR